MYPIIYYMSTVGFYADNGGEFGNHKIEEFVSKLGIKIEFGLSYLPWSNRLTERNHYSADVVVRKLTNEDKKLTLNEAVEMAAWTTIQMLWLVVTPHCSLLESARVTSGYSEL